MKIFPAVFVGSKQLLGCSIKAPFPSGSSLTEGCWWIGDLKRVDIGRLISSNFFPFPIISQEIPVISATPVQLDSNAVGKKCGVVMQSRADSQGAWFLFPYFL